MFEIQTPFKIKGIPLKPELKGSQKVDETLIQSLAAVMGFDGEARRLITCALGGALHTISPQVAGIFNHTATGAAELLTFADQPTTEVMIQAGFLNVAGFWVNIGAAASAGNGWRIPAAGWLKLSINNMSELNINLISDGNQIVIIRTV